MIIYDIDISIKPIENLKKSSNYQSLKVKKFYKYTYLEKVKFYKDKYL